MEIISFNGHSFAVDNVHGGIPWDAARGQFSLRTNVREAPNAAARIVGGSLSPRRIPVDFVLEGPGDARDAAAQLLGRLDPTNPEPRELVMAWRDGTHYVTLATVELTQPPETLVNIVPVAFVAADPIWRKVEPDAVTQDFTASAGAAFTVPITNAGQATAHPHLTFAPTSRDSTDWALFVRRTLPITNNTGQSWRRQPVRIDLGDTSTWSIFNPFLPNDEFYIFLDGLEVPRIAVNLAGKRSFAWIVVDELAVGETLTYDICYGNGLPGLPKTLSRETAPAFDTRWNAGAADGGSTTTLTRFSAGWALGQWNGGTLYILSGPDAGQTRTITATTTSTTVQWATPLSAAPTGQDYLLTLSSNAKWVFPVQQQEDNRAQRGLWWINRGQNRPSITRFDVPGSWEPYLFLDNTDEKTQTEWVEIDVGTNDFFSILDAIRIWDGAVDLGRNEGNADGVTFSSPWPITHWTFDSLFKNPVPMAKGFFGSRESGAGDWERVLERTGEFDNLTADAVVRRTLSADVPQHHLVAALLPVDENEIPLSWARESGTSTGGGGTTLQDTNKAWVPGQWKGATIRIIDDSDTPTANNQRRTIIGNSDVLVTVDVAWTVTPGANAKYEIIAKRVAARLRSATTWEVEFDTTGVSIGPISAETTNYRVAMTLRVDGGTLAVPAPPYDQLRIGIAGRQMFLSPAEDIRIDCARRRAAIHNRTTGAKLRDLTEAVTAETITADGTRLATDWLALSPGDHDIHVTVPVDSSAGPLTVAWTEGILP